MIVSVKIQSTVTILEQFNSEECSHSQRLQNEDVIIVINYNVGL